MQQSSKLALDAKDASMGAIFGAFIGDAAGAVLEFNSTMINENGVNNALTFPGGGVWELDRGQITDDSEMAMSLLQALNDSGKNTFNQ